VYLGIHWLAIGSMLALIGTSLFVFGTVAKVVIRRRHPTFDSRIVDWVLHRFRVEAGLLAGLGLAAIGAAVVAAVVIRFVAAGGGPSEGTVHPFTAAATVLAVGVEIALGSFLLRLVAEEAARDEG
jgi:mannose/fructose/N-acetylgalactosamine-specific phosphotransferase system component IIC